MTILPVLLPAVLLPAVLLPAVLLALATIATKTFSGYRVAAAAGIGIPSRWRTGFALTLRGEFSIVIAGLSTTSGIAPQLAPFAKADVLLTVVAGPLLARMTDALWFRSAPARHGQRGARSLTRAETE